MMNRIAALVVGLAVSLPALVASAEENKSKTTKEELHKLANGEKTPRQTYDGAHSSTSTPVAVSTGTARTPEQAIKEYKDSGRPPGLHTLKINPVPAPVTKSPAQKSPAQKSPAQKSPAQKSPAPDNRKAR
jgi:hypothetical protein